MGGRHRGFQDLPTEVAQRLERRIIDGTRRGEIPESASTEEAIRLIYRHHEDKDYSERELEEIVDAFNAFNNAVRRGLPNQLYQTMIKALNFEIGREAYAAYAVWFAHEGPEYAKEEAQLFANWIKNQVDERAEWDEERFHAE